MAKDYKVDKEILFCAFRYALGRMSYIGSTVIDNIKFNIDSINDADISSYISEIEECASLGMEMDKIEWLEFKKFLEAVLKNRQ